MGTQKQLTKLKLVIGSWRLKACPVSQELKDERQEKLYSCSVCLCFPQRSLWRVLRGRNIFIHPVLSTILLTVWTAGRSQVLQEFFLSAVNSDFLHLHQYSRIFDLLIDLLQRRFWLYISKYSTQMMFTHCKCERTLYILGLVYIMVIQSKK